MEIVKILKNDIQTIYGVIVVFSIPFIVYLIAGTMNLFIPTFSGGEVTLSIFEILYPSPNSILIFSSSIMLIVLGFGAMVFVPPDLLSLVSSEVKSFGLEINQIPLRRIYKICSKSKALFSVKFNPINIKSREWAMFEITSTDTHLSKQELRNKAERVGLRFDEKRRHLRSRCDVEELPWRIIQFSRILHN